MKTVIFCLLWASTLLSLTHCATAQRPRAILAQAGAALRHSAEISAATAQKLGELIQQRNNINVQGRSLTQREMDFVDSVYVLETAFLDWERGAVPVPGYDPAGHRLKGAETPPLSRTEARRIWKVQQGRRQKILEIFERARQLVHP